MSALESILPPETRALYQEAMHVLERAGLRFLVGGAYALYRYAGIQRHTKDLDIFVHPDNFRAVLAALAAAGFHTEVTFPHWLGKAYKSDEFVDIIFSSGNGAAPVDEQWFEHAVAAEVLEVPAQLVPVEEMIWQKTYIKERERYDGADVAHLFLAHGRDLDWPRLLSRFGPHWRLLLGQLVMFGFIYPSERRRVPEWVMHDLMVRLQAEVAGAPPEERVCQGTLLSREQHLVDIERWGYLDPREKPRGTMTQSDIVRWTQAITEQPSPPPGHVAILDISSPVSSPTKG
jgi:hypothetical protein